MSQRVPRIAGVIVAILSLAVLAAGCNLAPAPAPEKQAKKVKKVPIEKVKTVKTPSGWPEEAPLYPNAELESATSTPEGFVLVLKTQDTADQIFNWYYDELDVRKWAMLGPTLDVSQNVAIIKAKLDDKTLYLEARTSESEPDLTALSLSATAPQPQAVQ